MNKKEVQKRVLQNGKPLALKKFSWDSKTNTFSSEERKLVIDFNGINYCTFITWHGCTFTTGHNCTFTTGRGCTFKTGYRCTFKTGSGCTFTTGRGCTFKTGHGCTFKTGHNCTFKTEPDCTFTTGHNCTFTTGSGCTFTTWSGCTWKFSWGKLKESPLHINGSMYPIQFLSPGVIKSGCIEKPLVWWKENITRCAEENGYTPEQVKEYEVYIAMLEMWMVSRGLEGVKGDTGK
jgi:hypothetical protein